MFIYTLQKRHNGNETICELASQLLTYFSERMPIKSPIQLESLRTNSKSRGAMLQEESFAISDEDRRRADSSSAFSASPHKRAHTLPSLGSPNAASRSPIRTPRSPATTMSSEAPTPYASHMRLPITRPPTSPSEQSRRSRIFGTPKLAAVEGDKQRRCQTPNASELHPGHPPDQFQLDALSVGASEDDDPLARKVRALDPLDGSPPKSRGGESPKKRVVLSDKCSWNPECINSVSGFEWWWRSLPQNHTSLEPTQKLKMVTKAAVRLHTKGDWQRAIDLYLLSLSMEINEDVEFRLRINLACAYEAAQEFAASIHAFKAALELNPTDSYAQFKLGKVLGATGAFDEARKLFESVSSAYPQADEALKRLRQAKELQIQEEEAKRAAVAAAKLRRSPSKQKRSQQNDDQEQPNAEPVLPSSICQSIAPSIPTTAPPVSRRAVGNVKKSDKHSSKPLARESSEQTDSLDRAAPPSCTDFPAGNPANDSTTEQEQPGSNTAPESPVSRSAEPSFAAALPPDSGESELHAVADTTADSARQGFAASPNSCLVSSVATMTDECVPKPDILDALVKRCTELRFDLKQYMLQIDQHQQGLIRVESLAEMYRILCGIDASASDFSTELKRYFPEDLELYHRHTILRYRRFLEAYEAKHVLHGYRMSEADRSRLKPLLEGLAEREIDFFVRFLADTKTAQWVGEGTRRAVDLLKTTRGTIHADGAAKESPGTERPRRAVEEQDRALPQDPLEDGLDAKVQREDLANADPMLDDEESDSFGIGASIDETNACVLDGYSSLSPHLDEKRDKAREQYILRREKSRIISRKHTHCVKSLRDIVLRARNHQAARREALAFLAKVAHDARIQITREKIQVAATEFEAKDVEEPRVSGDNLVIAKPTQAYLQHLSEVSHSVYATAVTSAMGHILALEELNQLQSLARKYASFSRVPPYFLEICSKPTVSPIGTGSEAE